MAGELWLAWAGVALVGGALALDDTSLGQLWFSQPLPAALLTGLVLGDPAAALVPGVFMQLLVLGNLPVGAAATLDHTSATVGVVAGAVIGGFHLPADLSLTAVWSRDTGAEIGLMLVFMAVLSQVAGALVDLERRNHLAWKLAVYRQIRDGRFDVVDRLQGRALGLTVARGAAVSLLLAVLISMAWRPLLAAIPDRGLVILSLAPVLCVPVAVGTLAAHHGLRRSWFWILAPALLGALLVWRVS